MPPVNCKLAHILRSWALILALLPLAACGTTTFVPASQEIIGVGGTSPEQITEAFFYDLAQALADPNLDQSETRLDWATKLAGYFAPNEREDQQQILVTAFAGVAGGLAQLPENQHGALTLQWDQKAEVISTTGEQAMVRPINARLILTISEVTDEGLSPIVERETPLSDLVGNEDGAVPVIKVDERWFLTEG